jgi:hypothetical protein
LVVCCCEWYEVGSLHQGRSAALMGWVTGKGEREKSRAARKQIQRVFYAVYDFTSFRGVWGHPSKSINRTEGTQPASGTSACLISFQRQTSYRTVPPAIEKIDPHPLPLHAFVLAFQAITPVTGRPKKQSGPENDRQRNSCLPPISFARFSPTP